MEQEFNINDVVTPWEEVVQTNIGKECKVPSFDEVSIPEDFSPEKTAIFFSKIKEKQHKQLCDALFSEYKNDLGNIHKSQFLDSENKFDQSKFNTYIELVEMIRNLPDDMEGKEAEVCKKIAYKFASIFK